jgi:hypothetical protein
MEDICGIPFLKLQWNLSKPKTCPSQTDFTILSQTDFTILSQTDFTILSQTDFTIPSTKCLCILNLCKPNTCLNWTNSSVPKGFGLDRFYCSTLNYMIYIINIYRRDFRKQHNIMEEYMIELTKTKNNICGQR